MAKAKKKKTKAKKRATRSRKVAVTPQAQTVIVINNLLSTHPGNVPFPPGQLIGTPPPMVEHAEEVAGRDRFTPPLPADAKAIKRRGLARYHAAQDSVKWHEERARRSKTKLTKLA